MTDVADSLDDVAVYRCLDTSFRFLSDRLDVLELLDHLWSHCLEPAPSGTAQHPIEIVDEPDGWLVGIDGEARATAVPDAMMLERVVWEINRLVRDATRNRALLHSAVVGIDGHGVMLVGVSGSGKSTLALGLCERGATYLSDEIAAVTRGSRTVAAYAKPLTLRRGSWQFAETLYPNSRASVAMLMADMWFVVPPLSARSIEIERIVLLSYEPDKQTEVTRLDPIDGALALCDHTHANYC